MPRYAKPSVLYVDDDEMNIATIPRFIELRGFSTATAGPFDVLNKISDNKYDVIVIDRDLGGDYDGPDIIAKMAGSVPDTAWILYTGSDRISKRERDILDRFGVPIVVKGSNPDKLTDTIHRLIGWTAAERSLTKK